MYKINNLPFYQDFSLKDKISYFLHIKDLDIEQHTTEIGRCVSKICRLCLFLNQFDGTEISMSVDKVTHLENIFSNFIKIGFIDNSNTEAVDNLRFLLCQLSYSKNSNILQELLNNLDIEEVQDMADCISEKVYELPLKVKIVTIRSTIVS
jgi:flagellin-specific chaperone FliS